MMQNIFDKVYNNLINKYPGYCLNLLGIIISIVIIFYNYYEDKERIEKNYLAYNNKLKEDFSNYIVENEVLGKTIGDVESHIKIALFQKPEQIFQNENENFFREKQPKYFAFVKKLKLEEVIKRTCPATINSDIEEISSSIKNLQEQESFFISNFFVFIIWTIFACIYLLIVGISYFGKFLETEQGEPILNIMTIGYD